MEKVKVEKRGEIEALMVTPKKDDPLTCYLCAVENPPYVIRATKQFSGHTVDICDGCVESLQNVMMGLPPLGSER